MVSKERARDEVVDERENPREIDFTGSSVLSQRQSGEYILQGDDRVWKKFEGNK